MAEWPRLTLRVRSGSTRSPQSRALRGVGSSPQFTREGVLLPNRVYSENRGAFGALRLLPASCSMPLPPSFGLLLLKLPSSNSRGYHINAPSQPFQPKQSLDKQPQSPSTECKLAFFPIPILFSNPNTTIQISPDLTPLRRALCCPQAMARLCGPWSTLGEGGGTSCL